MTDRPQRVWEGYNSIFTVLAVIVWLISFFGILAYVIHYIAYIASLDPSKIQSLPTPIDLAAVTATIGGLVLIGAFYKNNTELGQNLKTIAKLLLCSSVFFIVSFFTIEYVRLITSPTLSIVEWFYIVSTDIAIGIAGLTIWAALGLLVRVIPRI
jgi:hypothetical protein